MSTNHTTSIVSVSVVAGHINATSQPPHPQIGQQVKMGDNLYMHITPDVARQWIDVLTTITKESNA
jgi:hypothetical protein